MKKHLVPLFVLLSAAPGCLSMQSQSTLDAIQGAAKAGPVVEAYIEYPGPQAKWAGPASFTLHVTAKDAGPATIAVAPALFDAKAAHRALAEQTQALNGDAARERLGHLAMALQGADANFRGCLYPVRVRLIRADNSLVEKQGCRDQSTWSKTASEAVDQFITASLK